jgi:hypothetical protein
MCHFDGTQWLRLDGVYNARAVWGTKDNVHVIAMGDFVSVPFVAVGTDLTLRNCRAAIESFDGTQWILGDCASDLDAISTSDSWMTSGPGEGFFVLGPGFDRLNALYDTGTRWISIPLPDPKVIGCIGDPNTEIYAATSEGAVYYNNCPLLPASISD